MSGDHNMNQFTYGKAIKGANLAQCVQEPEQYRSVVEEQLASLESRIEFLTNALTTLDNRLAPVMRDNPCKAAEASLPCADSPLGKKLENFNSRMNGIQDHILYIIERLEI